MTVGARDAVVCSSSRGTTRSVLRWWSALTWADLRREEDLIRQTVLVRWVEGTTRDAMQAIADAFNELPNEIEEIRAVHVGSDLGISRPDNFDFAVTVDFEDEASYLAYREHPAHQRIVTELVAPVLAERAGVVFRSQ
jgi:hypothetical protein